MFRRRLMAATPLISIFLFFVIMFVFEHQKYAWLAFLLIPLMPIFLGYKKIQMTFSLLIVVIYLILGFVFEKWHPGWIIFLLIPIFHILFPSKRGINVERWREVRIFKGKSD